MRPPRLATWLLLTFGSGPDLDVIAGDLSEQSVFRSRTWYWRQVAHAIVIGAMQHLRQHWVLALRAICIGSVAMAIAKVVVGHLAYWVLPTVLPPLTSPFSTPILFLLLGVPAAAAGAVIARLCQPHALPFAMAFVLVVLQFELLPRLLFLIGNSFEHERFLPYLWAYVAFMPRVIGVVVTGVILGVVIARPAHRAQVDQLR